MDTPGTVTMTPEGEAVYRLDVTGRLRKADLDRSQTALAREIDATDSVKLLVVLHRFDGWDSSDNWSDLTFFATYGGRIARIAIVGPERWRSEMLMFAADGLRPGPVEYFGEGAIAHARAWLHE